MMKQPAKPDDTETPMTAAGLTADFCSSSFGVGEGVVELVVELAVD